MGSGAGARRSWCSGTRSPQPPPAPGCTERRHTVPKHSPGRGTERPGDPGPRERIPPRRPDARGPNSPQDHQLPVFHRLLVGGAGLLLAGGKHGAALGRRSRLHRDPRRVRATATLPSRKRGERAGERHGGKRGAGRPVPRLLRRGCARRPPASPSSSALRGRREPDPARNASGRPEPRGRRSARRRGAERAGQVGRPRRRPRLRAPEAPACPPANPRGQRAPCVM